MPEHTNLSITTNGRGCVRHGLVHSKVLVVGCHNLSQSAILMVKALKVLQYVYQSGLIEDAVEKVS